jgi:shikimate dehydrogenase
MKTERLFGLIGKNISYSFSQKYFSEKFLAENEENAVYQNFDIDNIFDLTTILKNKKNLSGLNVTIPYKEEVFPFLDQVSKRAKKIGAINTIKFLKNGKLKGYNTDFYGFKKSIKPLLNENHKQALILGTGGGSKAVAYCFKKLKIPFAFVSRTKTRKGYIYENLDAEILAQYQIIVNCTPLGTSPKTELYPEIPYECITKNHLAFDLIYNPEKTVFLQKAEQQDASIKNGLEMLQLQAEKAWEIWNR